MSPINNLAELAVRFQADRGHLRSVASALLGSASDAEDVVQSAWLKASRADYTAVENPSGWLTTITAREAVDQLRSRKRRAERSLADLDELHRMVGSDSPGPADEGVLLADSVGAALLVVLDRLSPAQRVAFVLHDVFGLPFETVADLLDRSPMAAKKLASRARGRLHAPPGSEPGHIRDHMEAHQKIVQAFLAASRGGDIATLLNLLAPGVIRTVDPELVPDDVPSELRGFREVADETRRFARRARAGVVMLIDGVPGIVIAPHGCARMLLQLRIGEDNRIHRIDITGDADRIRRAALALPHALPRWSSSNAIALSGIREVRNWREDQHAR